MDERRLKDFYDFWLFDATVLNYLFEGGLELSK